jgi:hypothetical protein
MGEGRVEDLLSLDRDVARGWKALTRWRAAMAIDPSGHAEDDPLEPVRHVAGKATWDALSELAPSLADIPLRDALKRWVFALAQARIGLPQEIALARAASDRCAHWRGDTERLVSWREAWRGVVAARSAGEASVWLDAAADAASPLAEVNRVRASRRVEVALRMGVEHPWMPLVGASPGPLHLAATRLLDATEDLSRAVWKEPPPGVDGPAAILQSAIAREAGEGWPARLTPHWLEEVFGSGPRGWNIDLPQLPAARGAASFARALYVFGAAVRIAAAPPSLPFALAREPAFVGAHRLGFVFGALAADAQWQGRVLCVGRRVALAQSRVLARSGLLDARLHSARLILGDDAAFAPRDRFDELGTRLFGRGLDARLRGAWPGAREDEPARFIALLQAQAFANRLRDEFDSDWYRNPRAWSYLRSMGAEPAHETIDASALDAPVDALARAFEGALG